MGIHGQCIICGKFMRKNAAKMHADSTSSLDSSEDQLLELCTCPSAHNCEGCKKDTEIRAKNKGLVKPHFTCEIHKDFKSYQECLLNYKNWCIVICTFFSIPLCLFCWAVNLNLTWTYYFTGILIASSVVPIALSILWARATSSGMIAGVVGGCLVGMGVWLGYASTFEGGLSAATFVKNTEYERENRSFRSGLDNI